MVRDSFLNSEPAVEALQKVWSEEARAAAAEARRNNARARSRDEGGPTETTPKPFEKPKFQPYNSGNMPDLDTAASNEPR